MATAQPGAPTFGDASAMVIHLWTPRRNGQVPGEKFFFGRYTASLVPYLRIIVKIGLARRRAASQFQPTQQG